LTTEMKKLDTLAKKSRFSYDGSVADGIKIYFGSGNKIIISSRQCSELLNRFRGKSVNIGTSRTEPPIGSIGKWMQENVTKTAIASYVGQILIHEGFATKRDGSSTIEFKSLYPGEA